MKKEKGKLKKQMKDTLGVLAVTKVLNKFG
jgi:hypothetical protein